MLIVHPLSRCDVCLDEYSFATTQNTPHVIPCGHVFCKPCLGRLSQLMCPLCRKSFRLGEIARLVIDRVPPDESGIIPGTPRARFSQTEMEEIELLQRLALASGEDTPEAELSEVIEEADSWLEGREPSSSRVLRKALDALRRSKRKETELANQTRAYSNLKSSYRSLRHRSEHEKGMSKAVEESLLAQVENIDNQHRAKMEEAECEIANLRREVARMTMRSRPSSPLGTNPLPPPPKPYNDDILPNLIDKGKGIDRQLHPQNSRDTETPRHPKGSDGRSGVQSATIEPLYVSRAPSDDWETWYPLYRDSHLSADSQDRTERVQSNGQNRRSLSVIPGAHHAQRVVPPVVGRAKERETEKGSPEGPSETMVLPSLRPMGWSAETLAAAGISTDDASTSRVDALPASNIPADDDRTPYLSSQSFTDLLNRPAAATEQDLHHGDSETDHLRTLLGLPQTVMQFNASRESQGHPSSLRPGSAVPGASWSATPAVANTAQVSQSTLGSLGLAGFNNPSGSTLHSSTNLHSGLGLQIGGAGYAIARPSVVHAEDDALDQSSSEDDDDGDHDFVTPRASSGNALLFSVDAAHRSSSRLRSYSMGRHDSGAVTDVEEARANTRSAMRPSHGRSVSQQLPLVGPSSSENSLISQRNGSSVIRMTPSHPPFSGHRPASGRRTLAPDPPPPTVSFIPPIHHSRGLGSSNTSVTNFPQDPSASSSNRTMLFNISSTGTLATQQGTSRPQREIVTAHPRSSSRHEYSEHWMSASSLSSRNAETTARQR